MTQRFIAGDAVHTTIDEESKGDDWISAGT